MNSETKKAIEQLICLFKGGVTASEVLSKLSEKEQTPFIQINELEALQAIVQIVSLSTDIINVINDAIDIPGDGADNGNENGNAD